MHRRALSLLKLVYFLIGAGLFFRLLMLGSMPGVGVVLLPDGDLLRIYQVALRSSPATIMERLDQSTHRVKARAHFPFRLWIERRIGIANQGLLCQAFINENKYQLGVMDLENLKFQSFYETENDLILRCSILKGFVYEHSTWRLVKLFHFDENLKFIAEQEITFPRTPAESSEEAITNVVRSWAGLPPEQWTSPRKFLEQSREDWYGTSKSVSTVENQIWLTDHVSGQRKAFASCNELGRLEIYENWIMFQEESNVRLFNREGELKFDWDASQRRGELCLTNEFPFDGRSTWWTNTFVRIGNLQTGELGPAILVDATFRELTILAVCLLMWAAVFPRVAWLQRIGEHVFGLPNGCLGLGGPKEFAIAFIGLSIVLCFWRNQVLPVLCWTEIGWAVVMMFAISMLTSEHAAPGKLTYKVATFLVPSLLMGWFALELTIPEWGAESDIFQNAIAIPSFFILVNLLHEVLLRWQPSKQHLEASAELSQRWQWSVSDILLMMAVLALGLTFLRTLVLVDDKIFYTNGRINLRYTRSFLQCFALSSIVLFLAAIRTREKRWLILLLLPISISATGTFYEYRRMGLASFLMNITEVLPLVGIGITLLWFVSGQWIRSRAKKRRGLETTQAIG